MGNLLIPICAANNLKLTYSKHIDTDFLIQFIFNFIIQFNRSDDDDDDFPLLLNKNNKFSNSNFPL